MRRSRKRRTHNRVHHRRRHSNTLRAHARRSHNPHRRHRRHNAMRRRHKNPFRAHRRHRNPIAGITGEVSSMLLPAGIGAAGAVGLDVLMAYLPVPASLQTGWGAVAVNAVGAAAFGVLAGMAFGRRIGIAVGVGGLTVTGVTALKAALGPTLGTSIKGLSGLADFSDFRGMGAYMGTPAAAAIRPQARMGAYMSPGTPVLPAPAGNPMQTLRAKQVAGLAAYMSRSRGGG